MIGNFDACDGFTGSSEGGLSMDPRDPGNWTGGMCGVGILRGTNYGISAASYPQINIAGLTMDGAKAIRRANYWTPNSCDELDAGLDLMVYDEDVNAGDARSAKLLQGCVGAVQDGQIGPHTLAAINAMDTRTLIMRLGDAQEAFYEALPGFAAYGHGWMTRLAQRQALALEMAG